MQLFAGARARQLTARCSLPTSMPGCLMNQEPSLERKRSLRLWLPHMSAGHLVWTHPTSRAFWGSEGSTLKSISAHQTTEDVISVAGPTACVATSSIVFALRELPRHHRAPEYGLRQVVELTALQCDAAVTRFVRRSPLPFSLRTANRITLLGTIAHISG
jgi:hypothetical protein